MVPDTTTDSPWFDITRFEGGSIRPLSLNGSSAKLLVQQKVEVEDSHVATLTYHYRYQLDEDRNSWLFRWEYFRHKPREDYPYPLAHFHVNARSDHRSDLEHVHFATRRVPLELVLWTLLSEWGVKPLDEHWETTLGDSIAGFDERRTVN